MIDTGDRDIIMELGKALMNTGIKLGRGLTIIVEVLLKVSMLKPAQEETVPQYTRPRVNFVLFHFFFRLSLISLFTSISIFVIVTVNDTRLNTRLCRR